MIPLTYFTIFTTVICYIIYTIMLGHVASKGNAYIEEKTHYTIAIPIAFTIICIGIFAPLVLGPIIFQ